MTKTLIKVTAEFEFVIAVGDDENEQEVCEKYAEEALADMSQSDIRFQTETYKDGCIDGWDESVEPYGGDGKSTGEWAQGETK